MENIKTFFESLIQGNYIKAVDAIKEELDLRATPLKESIAQETYQEMGFTPIQEEKDEDDEDKDDKDSDDEDEPSDKEKDDKKGKSEDDEDED